MCGSTVPQKSGGEHSMECMTENRGGWRNGGGHTTLLSEALGSVSLL